MMFVYFRYVDEDGVTINQTGRQVPVVPAEGGFVRLDRDGRLWRVLSVEHACTERSRHQRTTVRLVRYAGDLDDKIRAYGKGPAALEARG